jgi:hypothetical protein
MQLRRTLWIAFVFGLALHAHAARRGALALHPDNPHYFLFRGQPTVLITSGEHYGAVLNLDFGYVRYLTTLESDGLNLTRTFSGAYVEPQGSFNIARNTLAPAAGRFICPWARSTTTGYANGGMKFDLGRWDVNYFARLKDFLTEASKRGIVVEYVLFCPFYDETQWKISPQNPINNVNEVDPGGRTNVYTLDKNGGLLPFHEALVRKVVTELKDFDNLYYEICNEPYFGGVTTEWQHRIADVITETEKGLGRKHLISQNIANNKAHIENPHPEVSIFNFHYASPPDTVGMNYHLNKVIGDNETGFAGTNDFPYRREAWDFILAGGALFNNLDYSFTADQEDGTFGYPAKQPGGGNAVFRRQMRHLKDFINSLDFIRMRPETNFVHSIEPPEIAGRALGDGGKVYAGYFCLSPKTVDQYSVIWVGAIESKQSGKHTFYTMSNDGVRVTVDEKVVIDNWTDHSSKEDKGEIELKAGRKYPIIVEYYQGGGGAVMKLSWAPPGQKKQIIPESQLSTGEAKGLKGEYFFGKNFDELKMTRTDKTVNFDWTNKSPFDRTTVDEGKEYVASVELSLGWGRYRLEWFDPKTGKMVHQDRVNHFGGPCYVNTPKFKQDIALKMFAEQ